MRSPLGVSRSTSMDQYSRGLKASISTSRAQISRSATDCTRPAEREPGSLRQSTGESVKPTKIVERAARLVGVDQVVVEVAGGGHGAQHGGLRDLGEDHALDRDAVQEPTPAELVPHMPGDRLALAVRVGGEVQMVGAPERLADGADVLLGTVGHGPVHGERIVRPHRAVLGQKVAHVAVGGHDRVVGPQVPSDGGRLGGRFDDDDVHPETISGSVIGRR